MTGSRENGPGRRPEEDFGDLFGDEKVVPEKAPDAEADFGDLLDESEAPPSAETPPSAEEQAWLDSLEFDRERAGSMGAAEIQVQAAVVEALAEKLRAAGPESATAGMLAAEKRFRTSHLLRTGRLEAIGAAPGELGASVNQVEVMKVSDGRQELKVVYKPRDARSRDAMEADRFDQVENQIRKEWLGAQMDVIFDVGRNPAASFNEVPGTDGRPSTGGAVIEFRKGASGDQVLWEETCADDEISRVADFHYLVWESDGHNGQYLIEADGRLTTIDRGKSFMEGQEPLRSEAISTARQRKLGANPEVRAAVERFVGSKEMQDAAAAAFAATFGEDEGRRRFGQLRVRAEKYREAGGVPEDVKVERTPVAQDILDERLKRLKQAA